VGRSRRRRRDRPRQVEACQSAPKAQGVRERRFCKCLSRLAFLWVSVSICRKNSMAPYCNRQRNSSAYAAGKAPSSPDDAGARGPASALKLGHATPKTK
jgi:hypothetical protein